MTSRLQEWGNWARAQQRIEVSAAPAAGVPAALASVMLRRAQAVDRAIAQLDEKQRYVVEQHYRDGLSLWLLAKRMAWNSNGIYMAYLRPAYQQNEGRLS